MFCVGVENKHKIIALKFDNETAKRIINEDPEAIDNLVDRTCLQLDHEYEPMLVYPKNAIASSLTFPISEACHIIWITMEPWEAERLLEQALMDEPAGDMIDRLVYHVSRKLEFSLNRASFPRSRNLTVS